MVGESVHSFVMICVSLFGQDKLPLSMRSGGWGVRLIMAGVLSCLFTQTLSAQSTTQAIHQNWKFRQVGTEQWHPATVPGTVHTDLFANGIIEDPFKDNNEIEKVENSIASFLPIYATIPHIKFFGLVY